MTYRIAGIDLSRLDIPALIAAGAEQRIATYRPGFPSRATLEDAAPGEAVIPFHHVSHDVVTPLRSAREIAYVDFHNDGAGCFLMRAERDDA